MHNFDSEEIDGFQFKFDFEIFKCQGKLSKTLETDKGSSNDAFKISY